MILYCAADPVYFNNYFDLWSSQCNKYYPKLKKIIALYNPTPDMIKMCEDNHINWSKATLIDNPQRKHFYLLRWLNLPFEHNELIIETQINCIPIKTQTFPSDNNKVEQYRVSRLKRGFLGGVSAAVFTPDAAKKVVEQAKIMLDNPPESDHPMNVWQINNLKHSFVKSEQQFKNLSMSIADDTCWITAGTSQHYTPKQKIDILNYYINK